MTAGDWWRGAVIYQVYPRSFQDSDGDGVGDLAGLARRLDHVAGLGVDAIWISPFFPSPMRDFGYDVSDHRGVDPLFGSLADFDAVVARAHGLGLRVMIDLVLSHTSDVHPWFTDSRAARDGARADWYVWADPGPDGAPPNTWLSVFGGPAWTWEPARGQFYLHNFLSAQPDLNFHCPAVQEAALDTVRFWLDRGVDGFRLDTVNYYFCDRALRSNPPLPEARRNASIAPLVNPYTHQEHLHDKNQPETPGFLRRLRALTDPAGAVLLGEVGHAQIGLDLVGQYTAGDDLLHMCYGFEFLASDPPTAARVADVLAAVAARVPDGWLAWAFSNHDVVRHVTRWDLSPAAARCYATLLMCLRGAVCLYEGEELGLPEAVLERADIRDPYGMRFWPAFKGRDGCRTPMVWDAGAPGGGFTAGRPWLPIPPDHLPLAVAAQDRAPGTMLAHYRRAIALRRTHPALRHGTLEDVAVAGNLLHFLRRSAEERLLCAFNLGDTPAELPGGAERLAPWQACLAPRPRIDEREKTWQSSG